MSSAKRPGRRHLLAAARHPRRQDGAIAIALFLLPWAVALILVLRHHHLDGGAVAIVVAVCFGLPTLWLMWTTYRGPKRADTPASGPSPAEVADRLAVAVGAQWENEAAVRRLNDPWPLPVSWAAADAVLTDSWDSLLKLATSGAGWPLPPPAGTWAAGPSELAGTGGELVDVLARVPTGRLVVLGEPGAGKTMLMVRLVLDLLARRSAGGPVPFLASVASWDPSDQDLRDWLAAQLVVDHPALANPSPAAVTEPSQAAALLASGLILPILDGLDEIPEQIRGPAISRINDALRPGEQVVVTCRTQQYREAVRPEGGAEVTLRAAAGVELLPLDADAVRSYLCDDAAGPIAKARWNPVLAVLGTEAPTGQALSTPLMIGLARVIYNPRPGELVGTLRDPAELCSRALADRAAVESLLFDAFIPAAYRDEPAGRWKAQDAERWLVFLACLLERTTRSVDFAWWQLHEAVPRRTFRLALGLALGLVAGLAGFAVASPAGLAARFVAGLVVWLAFGYAVGAAFGSVKAPGRGMRINVRGLAFGLAFGLALGLVIWFAFGSGAGFAAMVACGLGFGLAFGLEGLPGDLTGVPSPRMALAHDRQAVLLIVFVAGLGAGLMAGLAAGLKAGPAAGLKVALALVLVSGLGIGFGLSIGQTAWPSYMITRGWLAFQRHLPWSLMSFLSDAHQRGVLRQAGAVYQFRHIKLQHRLASRTVDQD